MKRLDDLIVALSDGTFYKGQGYLRKFNKEKDIMEYCCLGVICSLENREWFQDISGTTIMSYGLHVPFVSSGQELWRYEGSELPPDLLVDYGLDEPIRNYDFLFPIAEVFNVYTYDTFKPANLQTLLIAINDSTNGFSPVRNVLTMIQNRRDEIDLDD